MGGLHPPCGWAAIPPARWADLPMLRPHSPTVRVGPTPYKGWAHLQGGQRSVSLEYQTCTSAYLFDTLVTGRTLASFPRICERKYTSGGRLPICRWIAIYIRCKSVIGKWLLYEVIQDILTTDPNIDTLCISRLLIDMVHWKISHVHSRRPKILIWYPRSPNSGVLSWDTLILDPLITPSMV